MTTDAIVRSVTATFQLGEQIEERTVGGNTFVPLPFVHFKHDLILRLAYC